jgi:peptide/nickel transport system substrate-binding protein
MHDSLLSSQAAKSGRKGGIVGMKRMRRVACHAVLVLTVGAVLGATAGSGSAGAATKPKSGGSIKVAAASVIPSLDPNVQNATPAPTIEYPAEFAIFDGLFVADVVAGAAKPRIATGITSKDNIVWTLKLRTGVKFSDGTTFDADAVKVNWDRIQNKVPAVPGKANYAGATWVVNDPQTLTITLKDPTVDFPYLLSTWTQNLIVSPAQIKSNEAQIARAPIGAGPYMVKSFDSNSQVVLVKNPNYYGKTYLDQITIAFVTDETQRLATIRSGDADMLRTTSSDTKTQAAAAGLKITDVAGGGGQGMQFNDAKPPFNDVRARQALELVFDAKVMNKVVNTGAAQVIDTLFPKGSPYYDASGVVTTPNDKKAQALLDQLAAEGKPVSFTLITPATPSSANVAQWLQTKLASFKNVTMKLNIYTLGSITNAFLVPGNFDAVLVTEQGSVPSEFATYFQTGGGKNYGKFSNPQMDAALLKAKSGTTLKARADAAKELQALVKDQVPTVFYQRSPNVTVLGKSIKGYAFVNYNVPDWTKIWKTAA